MNFQFNLKILLKSFFLFLFENNKILPQIANHRQNSRPGETDPYDPQDFSNFLISEKMSLSAVQTEDYIEEKDKIEVIKESEEPSEDYKGKRRLVFIN